MKKYKQNGGCSFVKPDKTGRKKPAIKAYTDRVRADKDWSYLCKMQEVIHG